MNFDEYTKKIRELETAAKKLRRKAFRKGAFFLETEADILREYRREVCPHKNVSTNTNHDPGGGMERSVPSTWHTEECDDCGAVLRFRGSRWDDEWKVCPVGSKNTSYGVAFPDGYVYDH